MWSFCSVLYTTVVKNKRATLKYYVVSHFVGSQLFSLSRSFFLTYTHSYTHTLLENGRTIKIDLVPDKEEEKRTGKGGKVKTKPSSFVPILNCYPVPEING